MLPNKSPLREKIDVSLGWLLYTAGIAGAATFAIMSTVNPTFIIAALGSATAASKGLSDVFNKNKSRISNKSSISNKAYRYNDRLRRLSRAGKLDNSY